MPLDGYRSSRQGAATAERSSSVVERVALILRAFKGTSGRLSLSELALRTGLPPSTLHRMARQMVTEGLLRKSGQKYELSLDVFELGAHVPLVRKLRSLLSPRLAEVRQVSPGFQATVHLAIGVDQEILVIERIEGTMGSTRSYVGARLPTYSTAMGKALFAYRSRETQASLFKQPLIPKTGRTIVSANLLRDEFEVAGDTGIAFDREETRLGVSCIAVPLVEPRSGLSIATISASGSTSRMNEAEGQVVRKLQQLRAACESHLSEISLDIIESYLNISDRESVSRSCAAN